LIEIKQMFKYKKYTEQNYKRSTFVFAPIFHELNSCCVYNFVQCMFESKRDHLNGVKMIGIYKMSAFLNIP